MKEAALKAQEEEWESREIAGLSATGSVAGPCNLGIGAYSSTLYN